jgi:hypothetical protein
MPSSAHIYDTARRRSIKAGDNATTAHIKALHAITEHERHLNAFIIRAYADEYSDAGDTKTSTALTIAATDVQGGSPLTSAEKVEFERHRKLAKDPSYLKKEKRAKAASARISRAAAKKAKVKRGSKV